MTKKDDDMDSRNKRLGMNKHNGFSSKEYLGFLVVFIFVLCGALYFSMPDDFYSEKTRKANSNNVTEPVDNNSQAVQVAKNREGKPSLFARLFKSESKNENISTQNQDEHLTSFADIVLEELQFIELKGSVVNSNTGDAISGVNVTPLVKGKFDSNITNKDGEFFLEFHVNDVSSIPLQLSKEGFRDTRFTVELADGEVQKNLLISMEKSSAYGALYGTVNTPSNEYIIGLLVELYSSSVQVNYQARTDIEGNYSFTNVEEAADYQIWVRPITDYQDYTKRLRISSEAYNFNITLQPIDQGYEFSGQVVGMDNNPVKNVTLTLRSVNAKNQLIHVTTDALGNFFVSNVPGGALIVESSSAPYYTLSGLTLSGENKSSYQTLVVDSGRQKLLGKVVDTNGASIKSPKISITSTLDINGMRTQSSRSTSSDAKGNFLFTDLGAQHYTITVNAPGFKGIRFSHQLGSQSPLIVRLKPNSS